MTGGGVEAAPSPWTIPEFRSLLPIGLVVALGFGLLVPVLPQFAHDFGVSLFLVGMVQFVFGFTRFSFGLAGGLFVDRFGERASVVTGILVVAASSAVAGRSETFVQLVASRGVGGVGSALFIAGLMNRILKVVPPGSMGRATGIWRTSFLVGIGIGPLVGGLLGDRLGLRAPFYIYAFGLVIAAVVAWRAMAAPTVGDGAPRRPLEALRAAVPLLKDARYVTALLVTLVGWWTLSGAGQQIGALFALERLGFTKTQFGASVTLLSIAEIIVVLAIAGPAADRFGRKAVLVPALAVTALATGLVGRVESHPWMFYVLMAAMGAGIAAASAAAGGLLADALGGGGSGAAVGLNQMAGDLGYMVAPAAMGAVADRAGYGPAYLVAAVPAILVLGAALRLPGRAGVQVGPSPQPVEPVG